MTVTENKVSVFLVLWSFSLTISRLLSSFSLFLVPFVSFIVKNIPRGLIVLMRTKYCEIYHACLQLLRAQYHDCFCVWGSHWLQFVCPAEVLLASVCLLAVSLKLACVYLCIFVYTYVFVGLFAESFAAPETTSTSTCSPPSSWEPALFSLKTRCCLPTRRWITAPCPRWEAN